MKYKLYRNKQSGHLSILNTRTNELVHDTDPNFRTLLKKYNSNRRTASIREAYKSIGLVKTPYGWE